MPSIAKRIRCNVPICESCQREELCRKVYWRLAEAGIDSLHEENEFDADDAVWDGIDAAAGFLTREVVQGIIKRGYGDYSFMYPSLIVDSLVTRAFRVGSAA